MGLTPLLPIILRLCNSKSHSVTFVGRNVHVFDTLYFRVNEYHGPLESRLLPLTVLLESASVTPGGLLAPPTYTTEQFYYSRIGVA